MNRRPRGQDGTTLLEVMITTMIIAVAFTALLGGLFTAVVASSLNKKLATAEATVRAYGEFMKRATYTPCPTTYSNSGFFVPTGYSASLVTIRYWDPLARSFGSCASPDGGMQLLTLRVVSGNGVGSGEADEQIQVVKRK